MFSKKNKSSELINKYYFSFEKRVVDVFFASIGIITLIPFWIVIALLIFLTSGCPIIFKQKRAGLHKKEFKIYKFRTMNNNAEFQKKEILHLNQAPNPMFKIFNDPRFTKIGKFMSQTGIDEIPQLINILKGEMSIIGPRPLPINEAIELLKVDPDFNFRFQIKPGVFSEWGLSENRHKSLKDWKKLDELTLKNGGWAYDMKLVFKILWSHLKKVSY